MENNPGDTDISAEVASILQSTLPLEDHITDSSQLSVHSLESADVLTPPAAIESQWPIGKKRLALKAVNLIPPAAVIKNTNHNTNFNKNRVRHSGNSTENISVSTLSLDSRTVGAGRNVNATLVHSRTNTSANNYVGPINKSIRRPALVKEVPKNELPRERPRRVMRTAHTNNKFVMRSYRVTEKSLLPLSSQAAPILPERKLTSGPSSSQAVGRTSSNKICRGRSFETGLTKLIKPTREPHRSVPSLNGDTKRIAVKRTCTEKIKKMSDSLIRNGPKAYEDKWCVSSIKNKAGSEEKPKTTSFSLGVAGNNPCCHLQKTWSPRGIVLNCLDTLQFKTVQWHMDKQLTAKENIWAPLPVTLQKNEHQLWKTADRDLKVHTDCSFTEQDKGDVFQSFSSLCDEEERECQQNGPIINNLAGALQEGLAQYMATNTVYRAPSLESLASLDRSNFSSDEESEYSDSSEADDSSDSWDSGYYRGVSYCKGRNEISSDADIDTDTDSDDDSLSDDLQKLGFRDIDNKIQQMAIIWGYCCDHFGNNQNKAYEEELADPEIPGECLVHNILAVRRVTGLSRRP